MSDISLSKAVRSNLLSLQNTADMMSKTQNRLATGNKVNSALDNPTNFFTASSLNSRAGDINQLLDGMANGIQTIEAADNGLTAITKTLESMQSTLRQARQDKSFQTESFSMENAGTVALEGGAFGEDETVTVGASKAVGTIPADLAADSSFSLQVGGVKVEIAVNIESEADAGDETTAQDVADSINNNKSLQNLGITATVSDDGNTFEIHNASGREVTLDGGGATFTDGAETPADVTSIAATGAEAVSNVDDMVRILNNSADTKGKVRASNDNGNLRIENLSTQELSVTGPDASADIGGNVVRADLTNQYNELRDQLDKLADDASFNGINLLRGDNLKITFNETGTSEIDIQSKGGEAINSATLGIPTNMEEVDFDDDATIDAFLGDIKTAINEVRSQASAFGSSLSIVQNRQDFSKNMINTLQTGAGNLTLADSNQEAANLLALQTRQQLSSTALSMASQQDQAVLRLF